MQGDVCLCVCDMSVIVDPPFHGPHMWQEEAYVMLANWKEPYGEAVYSHNRLNMWRMKGAMIEGYLFLCLSVCLREREREGTTPRHKQIVLDWSWLCTAAFALCFEELNWSHKQPFYLPLNQHNTTHTQTHTHMHDSNWVCWTLLFPDPHIPNGCLTNCILQRKS